MSQPAISTILHSKDLLDPADALNQMSMDGIHTPTSKDPPQQLSMDEALATQSNIQI